MINIKYIPNILNKNERLSKDISFDRKNTARNYLMASGFDFTNRRIILSGKKIEDLNCYVDDNEELLILPKTEGPFAAVAAFFEIVGFWATVAWVVDVALFLASIGYSIYAARQKARTPSHGNSSDQSPTYGWDGVVSTQDVGIPVPIVYGQHKVGGNIINAFISTNEDKNFLNILLGLCEGEINSISDIKINDNPIANYDGVTTHERLGTNTQSIIANFQDLHNVIAVNTQLLKDNSYVYQTIDSDVEGFKLQVQFPGGLYEIKSNGELGAWSVTYKVEYRITGVGAYTLASNITINHKSRTTVRRFYEKTGLTPGQYDIRITRTSDDEDDTHIGDLNLQSVDEIKTDDLAYPNTALLGIKALASEQLSGGMPNFTCIVKGKKVSVPNILNSGTPVDWEDYYWDPDSEEYKLFSDDTVLTWDGFTYVIKRSSNPIWCMKDLFTNTRAGLGEFVSVSDVDSSLFLEMSRHCEEKIPNGEGGFEKRFEMDVVLDNPQKAMDWVMDLSATFRGMPFYSTASIKIRIDKPEDPVQLFTMGNMIKDSFVQTWKSIKEVPNVIDIQFMDEDKDYKQEEISFIDEDALAAGDPMRKKSLRLFTTRISQALREARYALKVAKNINRSVTFKAGIDAIAIQPGDVFSISHDVPQWGYSGRIARGYVGEVMLDRDVTIEAGKTYKLRVKLSDDTIEEKTVSNSSGTTNIITVSSNFTFAPLQYSVYAFGQSSFVKKDFRCSNMERSAQNEITISGAEYSTNAYDDSDVVKPINNYSDLVLSTPDVEDLNLTERLKKLEDGTIQTVIDVWFTKPTLTNFVHTYQKALIYLSDNVVTSWALKGETFGESFSILEGVEDLETYKIAVVSVNTFNESNAIANSPQATISPIGKTALPSDVSTFLVNQSRDRLTFGWTEITDVDKDTYEIRVGSDWDSGSILAAGLKGDNHISLNFKTGASQSYWIKAIDTSGNYSNAAKEATVTIDVIPFQNIIVSFSEQTAWNGAKFNTEKSGNNLIISSGHTTGTYLTPIQDLSYVATFRIVVGAITSISQGAAFDDDAVTRFNTSPSLRFSGENAPGAATFEINTSEDNITWDGWVTWQNGDYKCRYYQLRMTLTKENVNSSLVCSRMDHYADLPDIDEKGEERVTVALTGASITFSKTFHAIPSINITILTGNGVYWRFTNVSITGADAVKLYDRNGVLQTGTFRWHSHLY